MILILILIISNMAQPGLCFYWNWRYTVHLVNQLSSNAQPLMVHVKSGDDDLGENTVWRNGEFLFRFKLNFWESTLFYCHFKHGNKDKTFDVFVNGQESSDCKAEQSVYWKVTDDGFYRSCDDKNYVKKHDWEKW